MGIFNFSNSQAKREQDIKKRILLEFLSLDELEMVWLAYVSRDKPTFVYRDGNGLSKTRSPKRNELIDELIKQVSLEGIVKVHPFLKEKLEEVEK